MSLIKKNRTTPSPEIDVIATVFLIVTPLLTLIAFPLYLATFGFEPAVWLIFAFLYLATGLSITAGYHRHLSHRAYDTHPWVRLLFLIFGAGAFQNSALKWCTDHRMHHRYVDHDKDPYNPKRGFFYSHMGWIFYKSTYFKPEVWGRDFMKDPYVMWQHKHYYMLAVLMGFGLPTLLGAMFGSAIGGFLVGGLFRIVFVHHATFCINSLCHIWGRSTYSKEHSAKDNFILAFFTYGEGYHNFHHQFANDYRNGIKWYHFDPTKWFIQGLYSLKIASNLNVTPNHEILLAKMTQKERVLFEEPRPWHNWVQDSLNTFRQSVEQAGVRLQEMKSKRSQMRREGKEALVKWKKEVKEAKRQMKENYRMWQAVLRAQRPLDFSSL